MNKTLLIAIVGCITGVGSLVLQLSTYLLTAARLKINIDDSSHSYFFNSNDFKLQGYKTNFSAVVSLVISNKSSYPLTIDNIYITSKKIKYKMKHSNDFKFQPQSIPLGENSFSSHSPSKPINLPLRIESFDTIFASVRFPFFEQMVDNNDLSNPSNFKLMISTPRKVYRHKVLIYEYKYYHDHLQELRNR